MNSSFFDSSSQAWLANKKRVGESYMYVCSANRCKRECVKDAFGLRSSEFCSLHSLAAPKTRSQVREQEKSIPVPKLIGIADRVMMRRRSLLA